MQRRKFIRQTGAVMTGTLLSKNLFAANLKPAKKRVAMVGTGIRGTSMWGTELIKEFADTIEFVGLCDKNVGRVSTAKRIMKLACPTYTDIDMMLKETRPEILIVTTMDSTHHEQIVKGLAAGADIVTEKPMTTDETKCQMILDAEKTSGKKVYVTFNYRYSPHRQKIYELLNNDEIGKITSVDFHWYLDTSHGADYFRRWHRKREFGGTLLVHKATHHFDLLNWWLNSDPQEVHAYGSLEFYGKNNSFRHTHCRPCPHKSDCKFYFDITKNSRMVELYVDNEKYDGYLRDGCVWKEDIDIFDKMAVQIKYANEVQVSYSLTTYSPYEGYRISFNGTKGKLDAWIHERQPWASEKYDEIQVTKNFGKAEYFRIDNTEEGHGGGDARLRKQLFNPGSDPYKQGAGSRDGAMSVLIGIAARQSIDTGKPVKIATLTSLKPHATRGDS